MAADKLGGGVDDDVSAPLDGPAKRGRRAGVVDDQRHSVLVRDLGQLLDIADVELRIAQGLGVNGLRLFVDCRAQPVEVVGVHKFHLDPELGQRVVKQVVGAAVERGRGNDLVSRRRQRDDDEGFGGLPRGQRQPRNAAFERGDALLEHVGGRVHDPGVDVAELLQGKQSRGVVGIVEHVGRGLVNRHGARLGCGVHVLAAVDGEGVEIEGWLSVAGTHCCCSPRFLMFLGTPGVKNKTTHNRFGLWVV